MYFLLFLFDGNYYTICTPSRYDQFWSRRLQLYFCSLIYNVVCLLYCIVHALFIRHYTLPGQRVIFDIIKDKDIFDLLTSWLCTYLCSIVNLCKYSLPDRVCSDFNAPETDFKEEFWSSFVYRRLNHVIKYYCAWNRRQSNTLLKNAKFRVMTLLSSVLPVNEYTLSSS